MLVNNIYTPPNYYQSHTYQQTLLHVDVAIEIVQTVPGEYSYDHTRNDSYGPGQQNTLPLGPLDVQETLREGEREEEIHFQNFTLCKTHSIN